MSLINFKSNENSKECINQKFLKIAGKEPNYSVDTETKTVDICCSPATKIGKSKDANIIVVLHGEIYYSCLDQASYLADKFAKYGDRFANEIHGSFAILLIDKVKDSVFLITDRINSRRVFYSQYQNSYCLSSHFSHQPWDTFPLDPTGIAWYLSNHSVRCNRTLFKGISIFERASIHQLSREEIKSEVYWNLKINLDHSKKSKKQLEIELSELLIQSVKRRLYDNSTPVLSLSAGYDSTTILGIFAYELQLSQVSCFAFDRGIPQPGSDAYQASLMAEKVGYSFELVESYTGNFIDFIVNNAQQSVGNELCSPCSEPDAWQTLRTKFSSTEHPAFFFGDECIGMGESYTLSDVFDLLASLQVFSFDRLSLLSSFLTNDLYEEFKNTLAEDIKIMIKNCPPTTNLHDAQFLLKLNEITANWILPYRESYPGQYGNVRNPLLDNDILNFIGSVPLPLRKNKFLYRHTVINRYPELFSIPRATSSGNYYLDLRTECIKHKSLIRSLIKSQDSRLDELIPPDVLLKLLDYVLIQALPTPSLKTQKLTFPQNFISKARRKFLPKKPKIPPTNAANILTKMLILRVALSH